MAMSRKLFAFACIATLSGLAACDRNHTADNRMDTDHSKVTHEEVTGVQPQENKQIDKGTDTVTVQKEVTRTITSEERVPTVVEGQKKLDINRMSQSDFQAIGIPDAVAKNIVDYRDNHDGFKSVDELNQVPGVSPALLTPIRGKLGLSPANH